MVGHQDLNLEPTGYEPGALPIELWARTAFLIPNCLSVNGIICLSIDIPIIAKIIIWISKKNCANLMGSMIAIYFPQQFNKGCL